MSGTETHIQIQSQQLLTDDDLGFSDTFCEIFAIGYFLFNFGDWSDVKKNTLYLATFRKTLYVILIIILILRKMNT